MNVALARLVGADAATQLEPVDAGHPQAEHHQRRRARDIGVPRLLSILEAGRLVAELLEHGLQQRAGNRVVVGEDDAHGWTMAIRVGHAKSSTA